MSTLHNQTTATMINKPRFRKGKKAFRTAERILRDDGLFHVIATPKQTRNLKRYLKALDRYHEQVRQMLRTLAAAISAASTAVQINAIRQKPIIKDGNEQEQRKLKAIAIAEATIGGAQAIAKAFTMFTLIFFLVTSCVTVPKGHNHSRKQHRLETTPKAQ